MALARIYTAAGLGQTIIRRLGDDGGPLASRVSEELDNLINWVKASPRCIHRDFAKVDSSGVGPDVLHTFSLQANSLQTNGDYLSVWYAGNFAANDRDKAVNAQFDGNTYEGLGITDLDVNIGWVIGVRIARISATSVRISNIVLENAIGVDSAGVATSYTTGGNAVGRNADFAVANLNSTAITMRVRSLVGAGAAAADVYQNKSIIELTQQ